MKVFIIICAWETNTHARVNLYEMSTYKSCWRCSLSQFLICMNFLRRCIVFKFRDWRVKCTLSLTSWVDNLSRESFSLNFRHPFESKGRLKCPLKNLYLTLHFPWYLPARTECNQPEPFLFKMKDFRQDSVCVIVPTFLNFYLFISSYSWICFLSCTIWLMPRNNHDGLPLSIVKIMTVHRNTCNTW